MNNEPLTTQAWLNRAGRTLWKATRLLAGWLLIVVGLVLFPLPIPVGLPLIIVGVLVVGRRDRLLRWLRVNLKLKLRFWATLSTPISGPFARWSLRMQRGLAQKWRQHTWTKREKTDRS